MGEVDDDERADLLQRVTLDGGRPVEVLQRLLVDPLDDLEEEVFLGGDVVVEAPLQDPDGVGDVLDRGRLVALLVEDAGCGLEDLLLPAARRTRTAALGWRPSSQSSVLVSGINMLLDSSFVGGGT